MKLSEFTKGLDRMILREEFDLELPVSKANISIACKRPNGEIVIHQWEYKAKEAINETKAH